MRVVSHDAVVVHADLVSLKKTTQDRDELIEVSSVMKKTGFIIAPHNHVI